MPAEINDIAMRASVAAINKGSSIRVYESDVFGGIREAMYEGKWTGGGSRNVIARGKIGSPVAATSLGLDFIRVYYIGEDNKAKEICYDKHGKHWYDGALNNRFKLAPYSGLAATFLESSSEDHKLIRLYGQLEDDNHIQEWCYDTKHGWTVGANLGEAIPGSSIAVATWGKSHNIRVYVQDTNLNIVEKVYDGSRWQTGSLHVKDATPRAALGVTSWTEHSNVAIRLYYGSGSPGNVIKEKGWDHSTGWYDGDFAQGSIPASHVAAIPKPVLRVYIQNGTKFTAVTEFEWEGKWKVGQQALPPA
ncbi:fungal fucose-specific lectin [Metarhizium robertsii]|uniref:Fungal fucose-specific lectin n=2 Tax=Metarhizium robertsii TaxID=568076 RepID=E9FBV0_METRA|nr:Fungal fucose-specific lectin [Metarhizium robertsii ARSEF 23]EFY94816.1 Fungal fucose-specific lectin [Metarhizium robertsii ARSEF 23]EXU97119.1 fungal fucose-specific lectin [Metarhizium robertsii]